MRGRCREGRCTQRWARVEARNGAPAGAGPAVWNHLWVMASSENLGDAKERMHTH